MSKNGGLTVGTREHYFKTVFHMINIMDEIAEKAPECIPELERLIMSIFIINNEYVLKSGMFEKTIKVSLDTKEYFADKEFQKKKEDILAKIRSAATDFGDDGRIKSVIFTGKK